MRTQGPRRALPRLIATLVMLAALHVVTMMLVEGLTAFAALRLTLTTLTTVGSGDLSAQTPRGRLATMGPIFAEGIWIAFPTATTHFECLSLGR